jgi:hypothetical protein
MGSSGAAAAAAAHTNAAAAAIARHWNSAAAALKPSAEARLAELTQFAEIAVNAAKSGQLPDLAEVPQQVLLTGGAAVSLAFLLLLPRGRRLVIGSLDTALATALCLALLALLLGLPLGAYVCGGAGGAEESALEGLDRDGVVSFAHHITFTCLSPPK